MTVVAVVPYKTEVFEEEQYGCIDCLTCIEKGT